MMKTFENKSNNSTAVLDEPSFTEQDTIRALMHQVSQLQEENSKLKDCFENATEEVWEHGEWEYGPWVEEEVWEYEDDDLPTDLPDLISVDEADEKSE